jgi:hypothetical protein
MTFMVWEIIHSILSLRLLRPREPNTETQKHVGLYLCHKWKWNRRPQTWDAQGHYVRLRTA